MQYYTYKHSRAKWLTVAVMGAVVKLLSTKLTEVTSKTGCGNSNPENIMVFMETYQPQFDVAPILAVSLPG